MRFRPLAILFLLLGLLAAPAMADPKPLVVVELYTSQGCSSCPPADALVAELAEHEDVLPLALHVDYWDYIGWKDSFASPEYTLRQKAYARMAHSRSIYTPQIIVDGVDHVVGYKPMKVADFVQRHWAEEVLVDVRIEPVDGGALRIEAVARPGAVLPGAINIDLVSYIPQASVDIAHGENAGKTITYTNIVQSWQRLGTWNGRGTFEAVATRADDDPYAVIVQAKGPGQVLAAFKGD